MAGFVAPGPNGALQIMGHNCELVLGPIGERDAGLAENEYCALAKVFPASPEAQSTKLNGAGLATNHSEAWNLLNQPEKQLLIPCLNGHSTSNCCSSKHAKFIDKFVGGLQLADLPRDTLAQLAEITDSTSYLKMLLILGEEYLIHDKETLLTTDFLDHMDSLGHILYLGKQERQFAAVSKFSNRLPSQITSRLMEWAKLPVRKEFTTLLAFIPAIKETVDRGVLVGNKSRVKNLLAALALYEVDPPAYCP